MQRGAAVSRAAGGGPLRGRRRYLRWTPERLRGLFERVDWNRTNAELAPELECTPGFVGYLRTLLRAKGYAVPRLSRGRRKRAPRTLRKLFASMDWRLSNQELAERTGETKSRIGYLRGVLRRAGYDAPKSVYLPRKAGLEKMMGAGLGRETDTIVAGRVGVSRERVRQVRVRYGIPRPPNRASERNEKARRLRLGRLLRRLRPALRKAARERSPYLHFTRRYGITMHTLKLLMKRSGIAWRFTRTPQEWFEQIDWSLSNVQIARRHRRIRAWVGALRARLQRNGLAVPPSPYPRTAKRRKRGSRQ